jgi:lysine 2,3-aminomutase
MKAITSLLALSDHGFETSVALQNVVDQFSLRITPHVAEQLQNPAISQQYVPSTDELMITPEELADPIGDEVHTPVKGITHRYADRVLLKPTQTCAVYCRFCFRRETVGQAEGTLTAAETQKALAYIAEHPQIWEVILSGGDPLVLSDRRLGQLAQSLSAIDHVKVLRLHTRAPIAQPLRITPGFIKALKSRLSTYMVLHINHADELTSDVQRALALMADNGIPMLSQSVLLRGVNDSVEALTQLMRALVVNRVKPYYLHQTDLAKGTGHFRVPLAEGQELVRQMRGQLSGLCQPTYIMEVPGGFGKVPVGPDYLVEGGILDVRGQRHDI